MNNDSGRSPDGSGYSAEPEPEGVSAVLPNAALKVCRAYFETLEEHGHRKRPEMLKVINGALSQRRMNMTDPQEIAGSFHYRDGVYFERQQDGTVLITKHGADKPSNVILAISKDTWPSIVAAVGKNAGREHGDDYRAASAIHNG